jgi:hypothetical protein
MRNRVASLQGSRAWSLRSKGKESRVKGKVPCGVGPDAIHSAPIFRLWEHLPKDQTFRLWGHLPKGKTFRLWGHLPLDKT